jgi:hypothetical protein
MWALLTIALIPIGYLGRFNPNWPEWFRNIWGNIAYETLWIFAVLAVRPQLKPARVALGVCLMTFGLEFLQISQHPILLAARSTLPGRLILGTTFNWMDLPQYVVGSTIGYFLCVAVITVCTFPRG